jgi:hypothetical protein
MPAEEPAHLRRCASIRIRQRGHTIVDDDRNLSTPHYRGGLQSERPVLDIPKVQADGPSTSGPSSILTADLLAPFAPRTAFPPFDYYEASAPPDSHQPTTSLPAAALAGQRGGRPRVVPTFTTNRSTRGDAQLYPGRLATSTPQPFLVASSPAEHPGGSATYTIRAIDL